MLLFLDSHCECGQDWLRPLLQRIKEEPRSFVVPIIDVIDDKTMQYYNGNGVYFQIGGFTWSGHFTWIDIPEHEKERTGHNPVAAIRTPTMAGGLFAVNRKYFWEVGSYDEEMDVWGGENLEMSFRVCFLQKDRAFSRLLSLSSLSNFFEPIEDFQLFSCL